MSLPRKDVRFYLDAERHAALVAICDAIGVDINDQVEAVITTWITCKVTEARLIARRTEQLGIDRSNPESTVLPRRVSA